MDFFFKQIKSKFSYLKNHHVLFFVIPILFGFWSYLLGQDRNADLFNYHLYNAFAFLNNKDQIDFGVAGLQGFFNPLIDIPYYLLINSLKPQWVAFIMGTINGLIFILIYKIIETCLSNFKDKNKSNIILFLAIAGCLTPNFLASLGNSMGDNVTALFGLSSVLIILLNWKRLDQNRYLSLGIAGLIIGLATGLKLTNAAYALALCLSLFFCYPSTYKNKLTLSFIFGVFVLLGISITGGFWYLKMWHLYQNPFFPSLSNIFPNEYFTQDPFYAEHITKTFGPKTIVEFFLWPFISTIDYHRAGRGLIHQILWPLIYCSLIYITYLKYAAKKKLNNISADGTKINFIFTFILIGYVSHVLVFSIQRYNVTVEVLTPFVLFLCILKLKSIQNGWALSKKLIIANILIVLLGGFGTWGHTEFKSPLINANLPYIKNAEKTVVIIPDRYSPTSWLVTAFPKEVSFYRLNLLPNGKEHFETFSNKERKEIYIIFFGFYNWRIDNVKKWNKILDTLRLLRSQKSCELTEDFIKKVHFRGKIIYKETQKNKCSLDLRDDDNINSEELNNSILNNYQLLLTKDNIKINKDLCELRPASFGNKNWRYFWCPTIK
jgi:hypothetical protein